MSTAFEFATATRILFGSGKLSEAGPAAASMGKRPLLVMGCGAGLAAPLIQSLESLGLSVQTFCVNGEPSVETVRKAVAAARQAGGDLVIGMGGGSAIDTGKAVAALLANPGDVMEYLEVIGQGKALSQASLPLIAIPTTAGTGAEVTRNAVVGSPEHKVKVSLRSPTMLARLAIVDPQLTLTLPPEVTASTGLDALTQLIEPFVSVKANPLTDAICREGMGRVARSLRAAFADGSDLAAREGMSLASLLGGLALANAALGAVHGFAGPIGGMFPGPHGAICARLLPLVMAANLRLLQARQPESPALGRYAELAQILTGDECASASDGVEWVAALCEELHVKPLAVYGVSRADVPTLVEMAARASSMKGNPLPLSTVELSEILESAL